MRTVDTAVIGGGILGCLAARNLMRWNMRAVLIEEKDDVCTGVTRANSAVVYAGYDHQPGSLKAAMTVQGNADFEVLCEELEVPFLRRGSLMAAFGPGAEKVLQKKYSHGLKNHVPGLQLLSGKEACKLEPHLACGVTAALYAPTTGTVNPWQLGIAAYENALQNGCDILLNTKVLGIQKRDKGYLIETDRELIACRAVLNCAGIFADKIQEMLFPPSVRLFLDGTDFLVLDRQTEAPKHIIFHESEEAGKGITAVPAVEGNLLLGSSKRAFDGDYFAVISDGMERLRRTAASVLPNVDLNQVIRSFGAVRPNPYQVKEHEGKFIPDGKSIGSFVIENPSDGFYSLIGIKTPGLTCADELGKYLARQTAAYLDAGPNKAFNPKRRAIKAVHRMDFEARASLIRQDSDYGDMVCPCEDISRAEIVEAIRRGAVTIAGVKRRVGAGMGRCQGSRCSQIIAELLEEVGHEAL